MCGMHAMVYMWRSEDNCKHLFSPSTTGIQVIGLGSSGLVTTLLSHLTCPIFKTILKYIWIWFSQVLRKQSTCLSMDNPTGQGFPCPGQRVISYKVVVSTSLSTDAKVWSTFRKSHQRKHREFQLDDDDVHYGLKTVVTFRKLSQAHLLLTRTW